MSGVDSEQGGWSPTASNTRGRRRGHRRFPPTNLRPGSPLPAKETPIRHAPTIGTRSRGQPTEDQVAILRSAGRFPSDATAEEIAFGLEVARLIGLDPWLGQVKFLRFDPADKIHPFVGIDGMRAVAERSGKYDGREIEVEMAKGPDGSEKPLRAICRVHRKDWSRPLVEEVRFDEAVRKRRDGLPTRPWVEMPVTMLRKTAEERALRAAFPVQLSGVYGEEEAPAAGTGSSRLFAASARLTCSRNTVGPGSPTTFRVSITVPASQRVRRV